ncbi:hypothetical protein NL676_015391 [Syzygium grande]|nr:hypothetical protein NL676_015391 [Syzygium grande]
MAGSVEKVEVELAAALRRREVIVEQPYVTPADQNAMILNTRKRRGLFGAQEESPNPSPTATHGSAGPRDGREGGGGNRNAPDEETRGPRAGGRARRRPDLRFNRRHGGPARPPQIAVAQIWATASSTAAHRLKLTPSISRKERDERRFVHDRSLRGAGASGPGFLSVGASERAAWLPLDGNRRE